MNAKKGSTQILRKEERFNEIQVSLVSKTLTSHKKLQFKYRQIICFNTNGIWQQMRKSAFTESQIRRIRQLKTEKHVSDKLTDTCERKERRFKAILRMTFQIELTT